MSDRIPMTRAGYDKLKSEVDQLERTLERKPKPDLRARPLRPRIDLVAHLLAQGPHAVRAITFIAHRQQPSVFRVEQE